MRRYGTEELSEPRSTALEGRTGCLLANHGMIAIGANLDKAMWLAVELETIARQYYLSLALGEPHILSEAEIAETRARIFDLRTAAAEDKPATPAEAKVRAAAERGDSRSRRSAAGKR